jgi:hypothetical protein
MKKTSIISPTTKKVKRVCNALDALIAAFIDSWKTLPRQDKYESGLEAWNLFKLAIRNLEGVIHLARHDLVLLPPALAAARACFECAIKAAWMVNADDHFAREARWLVHLASEERYCKRVADQLAANTRYDVTGLRMHGQQIRQFRLKVEAVLPKGTERLSTMPTFDRLLEDVGGGPLYPFYIELSQSAHGEHQGTWLYRSGGVGTHNKPGEFIDEGKWFVPLRVCFLSLSQPGRLFLERLGGDPEYFITGKKQQEVEGLIAALSKN